MLESRINKRIRALKITSYEEYYDYVTDKNHEDELVNMIDEVSTNITHFFRDATHFEYLEKYIEKQIKQGKTTFRVWCCAASTGQEPYTIAMVIHKIISEYPQSFDVKILATDISTQVLKTCETGHYTTEMLEDIPVKYKNKYFKKINNQELHEVDQKLKNLITFRRLNLSVIPYPLKNKLDVVFIRNVMIYFDKPTKTKILKQIGKLLSTEGIVITGSTESLTGINNDLERIAPSIYHALQNTNASHKAAS